MFVLDSLVEIVRLEFLTDPLDDSSVHERRIPFTTYRPSISVGRTRRSRYYADFDDRLFVGYLDVGAALAGVDEIWFFSVYAF
jgi:hypothetical protein